MRQLIAFVLLSIPAALVGQQSARTISPGMTRAQVVAALGAPATERVVSDYTYMFYRNTCGRACGMNDLVTLHGDSVVDAIFRAPERHYTGVSSSPQAVPPAAVAGKRRAAKHAATETAAPTRMKPPAKPNDAKPSIPLNEPKMAPAPAQPAKKPAT